MEAEPHPAHTFDLLRLTSPRGSPSAIARDRREAGLPPALTDPLPLYQRPFSSPVDGSVKVFALVVSDIGLATVNQFRHVQAFIRVSPPLSADKFNQAGYSRACRSTAGPSTISSAYPSLTSPRRTFPSS